VESAVVVRAAPKSFTVARVVVPPTGADAMSTPTHRRVLNRRAGSWIQNPRKRADARAAQRDASTPRLESTRRAPRSTRASIDGRETDARRRARERGAIRIDWI
jgi:hypothetical protein